MKIINKITVKDFKKNKSRVIVTIIAVIISVSLITIVANMVASIEKTVNSYFEKQYGNYDISLIFDPSNKNSIKKLELNRKIQSLYIMQDIGLSPFEDSKSEFRKAIDIKAYNEEAYKECFDFVLKEGRFPKNSNEVVLSKNFINFSNKKYNVGDKITLDVGIYNIGNDIDYIFPLYESPFDGECNFVKSFKKTYTITGILERGQSQAEEEEREYASDYYDRIVNVYTYTDLTDITETAYKKTDVRPEDLSESWKAVYPQRIYIKLSDGDNSSLSFLSRLTGIDISSLNDYFYSECYDKTEVEQKLNDCEFNIWGVEINDSLHRYSISSKYIIFYTGVAVIIIIMISSILIIKNAFSISVTEKTVLYGRLATMGATPEQIRNNVFFEGLIFGIIGIPIGLIIGIWGTSFAAGLTNSAIFSLLDGMTLEIEISWISAVISLILGAATIFLSCLSVAVKASNVSPIESVRRNRDIKINKSSKKNLRQPLWIDKIFGIGGKIAWRNMKRSRRQYRTTVISVTAVVAVLICVASFINYTLYLFNQNTVDYKYNMSIDPDFSEFNDNSILDKTEDIYLSVSAYDDIDNYYYYFNSSSYTYTIPKTNLSKEIKKAQWVDGYVASDNDVQSDMQSVGFTDFFSVYAYDDKTYRELLKKCGCRYEDMKDKAIFVNSINAGYEDKNDKENPIKEYTCRLMDNPVGCTVSAKSIYEEYADRPYEISIEIGGEITDMSLLYDIVEEWDISEGGFIVNIDWLKENYIYFDLNSGMRLNSSKPDKTEKELSILAEYISLSNRSNDMQKPYSMLLLIQFSVYGLISAISLIGITNIVNTVLMNTRLRQKEYAMLRSVGMTRHEFNRMTLLECLFYTIKSLLIGISLGLVGTGIIHYFYSGTFNPDGSENPIPFMFPWESAVISAAAVTVTVLSVVAFSVRKVHKQNIIETIRNDNI